MKNIKLNIIFTGAVLLATGLFLALPQSASAQNPTVSGSIMEPDGTTPVPNASVVVHDAGWSYMNWGSTTTDGSFIIYDVPAGTYTFETYAYHGTYFDPEPFDFYYNGSGTHNLGVIELLPAAFQLTLTKSDSITPVPYYQVCLHDSQYYNWNCDTTDENGVAAYGLSSNGTYYVEMWDKYEGESPPDNFSFTYSGTPIEMSKSFKAPNVYGYIKKPGGAACTNTECSISFFDNNWSHYYWASPDESGFFALNIDNGGSYKYRIDYSGTDNYSAPEETAITVNASGDNDLGTLYLLNPNITGRLVDGDGNPISNVSVNFHSANWMIYRYVSTRSDGTFGFYVSTNTTYYLEFWIDSWTYPDYAAPATQEIVFSGSAVNLGDIEVGVPAMKIKVRDSSGDPVAWANVDLHDSRWSMNGSYWGSTNESGEAVINRALPTGNYFLRINPPWDAEGLLPSDEISVSLTEGETHITYYYYPIVLGTAQKHITGTVKYPDGRKVTDASIETWVMGGAYGGYSRDDTDSNGNYSLLVGQGEYMVNIWPNWGAGGEAPDWGSPGPQMVEFTQANNVSENTTINFTVAEYNSTITGKIVKPDGSAPGENMSINVNAWEKGGYMGNNGQVDSSGNFSLKVAGGRTYEINIWAWNMSGDSEYAGPSITPTKVSDGASVDLGTITLVEKTATITGKVTDTNGEALSNQYIDAWSTNAGGWGSAMTDENGDYTMAIFPGTYMMHAFPSWESSGSGANYVSIEAPRQVTAIANTTTSNINFQLGIADATIKGHLEDADGNLISGLWGWVNASNSIDQFTTGDMWFGGGTLGGPLNGGQFEIDVPAGKYTLNVFTDWNSSYTQSAEVTVDIGSSETKDDVVITMLPNNATIEGRFVDTAGNPVYDVWGQIFAKRPEGGSAFTQIDWDGTYSLNVAAGIWNMNYFIDPFSGAAYLPTNLEEKSVTIGAEETLTLDFTLLEIDSVITGTVQDEDGNPIEGANVFASLDYAGYQRDEAFDHYGFNSMEDLSGSDGSFSIEVPQGEYYLNASLPPELGYIFTGAQLVYTSPNDPANDIEVVFETADSQITGLVLFSNVPTEGFIYGYTDDGGYSETSTSNGLYTLPVTSGLTWLIGAVDEDGNSYYLSDQESVEVADENSVEQDLELEYEGEMPDPVSSTFDATIAKIMELPDGMQVEMPARSLGNEGSVTVTIEPTAEMPYQAGAQPLAGYGYEIEARDSQGSLITSFNSDVTLTLPYDSDVVEDLEIEENNLSGEYYDTTSGVWKEPTTNILDETNDTLTVTTDHFSAYSAVAPGVSRAGTVKQSTLTVTLTAPTNNTVVTTDSVLVTGTVSDPGATVSIRLNGVSVGAVTVDSNGAFSQTVTGLVEGDNTITVGAVKGLENATSVSRTVVYTISGDAPIDSVTDIAYDILVVTNENSAPHVRIFNPDGSLISQFFAFSQAYRGEFRVVMADIDGDNQSEIIAYPYGEGYGPQVRIFEKDGTFITQAMVLNSGYRKGISMVNNVDLDHDGKQDFIVVPRGNGGPNLRAYKYNTDTNEIELLAWTMAYDENYRSEINLTTADVTGDGNTDIIVSPSEGGPNVRVYHYDSTTGTLELDGWFMAYQEEFKGGVLIKTGDVNGDGVKDIITYPQVNGGANVRAYMYNTTYEQFELIDWIEPYDESFKGSLNIEIADLDKDSQFEIIIVPQTNGGPNLRVYGYNETTGKFELKDWEMVYQEEYKGGVGLAISNLDGDDYREIVTYPLSDGGPNVRVYEYDADGQLTLMDWAFVYAEDFKGEIMVNAGDLDGDGDSSLVITPLTLGGPNLRIYDLADNELGLTNWFMAYSETFRGGVITKFIQ